MLEKANITPNEIKELINIGCIVVNNLSYDYNRSTLASFSLLAQKDTYLLLDQLKSVNKIKDE